MYNIRCFILIAFGPTIVLPSLAAQGFPPTGNAQQAKAVSRIPGVNPSLSKNLADGAVGIAAKRLSLNATDSTGRRLLQFAAILDSDNKNLRYLAALVNLGSPIDPTKIPINVTEALYANYLVKLANVTEPTYFRLLLYNVVAMLDSTERNAIMELYRARENGLVADFDGVQKRLRNTFPTLPPPPKPLLPAPTAKALADGASKLAVSKFLKDGRQSEAGIYLMQFAVAIDPANENAFFLKALLLGNHPFQEIAGVVTEDAYFTFLKKVIQGAPNDSIVLLLNHILLMNNASDATAIGALTAAKSAGKDIQFQSLIEVLNRETIAASASTQIIALPPGTPSRDDRLLNSQLRDKLVSRKWSFHSLTTQQQWLFEFTPIGKAIESRGNCKGRRGRAVHAWKKWEVRDLMLIIDGYVKFKFDDRRRQWIPAQGSENMYFR